MFGVVSLFADMVYEGARSVTGPYLLGLGASALLVGVVTGVGEGAALVLRLVFGPLADRYGGYWSLAIAGYAMTAISVPLLALAPQAGGAALAVATTLLLVDRVGKAVRSPAKSTLLAHAARQVGRGRGFGVHKALDQVGAFAGPLLVAAVAFAAGSTAPALAVLAVPGAAAMALLLLIRRRAGVVPSPAPDVPAASPRRLPPRFHLFAAACALTTTGLMTFGVLSFHLVDAGLVTAPVVPLLYAAAMAVQALAALVTGWAYDGRGARVLLPLPLLVATVPALAFAGSLPVVLVGLAAWALAAGILDSTVKALVADLVPSRRLATAYGVFAAWQGGAAVAGGTLAGALYDAGQTQALTLLVAVAQGVALGLLLRTTRRAG